MNPKLKPILFALHRMFPSVAISGSKGQELGAGSFITGRTSTATVVDSYGLVVTCAAGETRYTGGRTERNIATASSIAVAGTMTLTLTAGDYVFVMGAGTGTATFSGTGGATGTLSANASSRTSMMKTITAGTLIITGSVATLTQVMVCDVSGRSNQNPPEYIDYNTVYNCGVVGVKSFDTTNGNTVSSNLVTEAQGVLLATKPTILVEPLVTSLVLYSDTMLASGSTWVVDTATPVNTIGVSGKNTAVLVTEAVSTNPHVTYQLRTVTANSIYTYCICIKPGTRQYVRFSMGDLATQAAFGITINTITMEISSSGAGSSASILNYSKQTLVGGWSRFTITGTINSVSGYISVAPTTSSVWATGTPPSTPGGQTYCLDSADIFNNVFASSHTSTTTAAVTRAKDTFSILSTGNIDVTKGLLLLRFTESTFATAILAKFISLTSGSNLLYKDISNNNIKSSDGTNTASLPVTFSTLSDCIFALAWSSQLGQMLIALSIDVGLTWTYTTASFDGSFTTGSAIEVLNTIEVPANLKAFKVYPNLPGNMSATLSWIKQKAVQETVG